MTYEPTKTKTPQASTPNSVQGRDLFQTPNYAVDILVPFIPERLEHIWEPAAGDGRLAKRISEKTELGVFTSDIRESEFNIPINFLTAGNPREFVGENFGIITNPPFSLKQKFYEKCREYNVPFALLIPADYSGWIIQATIDGAEKIIPTRRIDYITPNILTRIHEGEIWEIIKDKKNCRNLSEYKNQYMNIWITDLWVHHDFHNYKSIDEVPQNLLHKYSSSDFHSMWLTWGFNLGKSEIFVELSIKEKKGNI